MQFTYNWLTNLLIYQEQEYSPQENAQSQRQVFVLGPLNHWLALDPKPEKNLLIAFYKKTSEEEPGPVYYKRLLNYESGSPNLSWEFTSRDQVAKNLETGRWEWIKFKP